jgi:hypothetical protein
MLGVALAVPGAFAQDAVVFGVAYLLVRALHFVLSWLVARDDPDRRGVLLRFAPTAAFGASLILLAGFLSSHTRVAVWMIALAVCSADDHKAAAAIRFFIVSPSLPRCVPDRPTRAAVVNRTALTRHTTLHAVAVLRHEGERELLPEGRTKPRPPDSPAQRRGQGAPLLPGIACLLE